MSATTALRADGAKAVSSLAARMLPIGETGKYINGVAFKPTDWSDEGLPIVRIQNLTDRTKPMNRTMRAVDPAYMVQPGDLLVSWSATLDAFIWDREPALLNQHIFKVVPNTDLVSKRYLFYALRQAIVEMARTEHLHGSTMRHINRGPFLAHRIRVPQVQVQAEVVAELEKQFSRLDEAVANLKRVKTRLKRYEEATTCDASMAARRGSPICLASELFSWSSGVNLPASKQHGGSVPVYGGNGITGYHSQGNICQATVVIGRVGAGCGNVHLVREPAWITDNAIYASRVANGVSLPYAALMFSAANLNSGAAGSGQPFVNQRMLNEVQMPLPSLEEQRRIVADVERRLSIVREAEAEVDTNLKRAAALRQAVLSRAFQTTAEVESSQ